MYYPVVEIFQSIQGEGVCVGEPCNFVRLAGCPLHCPWCDTKYAWDVRNAKLMMARQILYELNPDLDTVVITGGEPLMRDLTDLVVLLDEYFFVDVETNGMFRPSREVIKHVNMFHVSPKPFVEGYKLHFPIEEAADIKAVVYDVDELVRWLEWADQHNIPYEKLVVQPRSPYDDFKRLQALWREAVSRNLKFIPQLHKLIWGEGVRI